MAATLLKRQHAVIWLPPRSIGERAFAQESSLLVTMASGSGRSSELQTLRMSVSALPKLKSATLIYDARDVTLLAARLPELPPARLLKALPNVVEDALLQDVAQCAFALGSRRPDGQTTVAVVDRGWLEHTLGAMERRGIAVTGAWPAQMVLPISQGEWSMACVQGGLALRLSESDGFGWTTSQDEGARTEAVITACETAIAQGASRKLMVYAEDVGWKVHVMQAAQRIMLEVRSRSLPVPRNCSIELLDARSGSAHQRWFARIDWRAWRWPAALAAAGLACYLIGLNLYWAQLASQRDQLKSVMDRRFRETFPNAQVVVDSMLQMRRQVTDLRARAGQPGPEDLMPMLARLGQAMQGRTDAVAGVEYREGRFRVKFQPASVESRAMRDSLIDACRRQGMSLKFDSDSEPNATLSLS